LHAGNFDYKERAKKCVEINGTELNLQLFVHYIVFKLWIFSGENMDYGISIGSMHAVLLLRKYGVLGESTEIP